MGSKAPGVLGPPKGMCVHNLFLMRITKAERRQMAPKPQQHQVLKAQRRQVVARTLSWGCIEATVKYRGRGAGGDISPYHTRATPNKVWFGGCTTPCPL